MRIVVSGTHASGKSTLIADFLGLYPGVDHLPDPFEVLGEGHGVELRVVRGGKRRGLIDQARDADLLVIDAPRSPSMSPLLAHRVVYAAPCPVVVMPPSISGAPESALSRSARAFGRAALKSAATSGRAGYRPPSAPDH